MLDKIAIDEEEIQRLTPIVNLILRRLQDRAVTAKPIDWLSEIDLSLIYPEFGITAGDSVGTDCSGVNSIELLRFFDKVIIRLDPVSSKKRRHAPGSSVPDKFVCEDMRR